jgi:hypothetical protein
MGRRREKSGNHQFECSFFDLPEEAVRQTFDLNFMGTF